MFKDIMIIMAILVIILMGYTVVVVSMVGADQPMSFNRFSTGFSLVYWSMFGNLPLEQFGNVSTYWAYDSVDSETIENGTSTNGNDSTVLGTNFTTTASTYLTSTLADNQTDSESFEFEPDAIGGYYLVIFLGVFVILTNLLLFNVLIAMFNYTFAVVQEKADEYWCYQRYKLITEYYARPPVPPPVLLVYHFWLVVRYIFLKIRSCFVKDAETVLFANDPDCKVTCDESVERQLTTWEDLVVDEYMESIERKEKDTMEKQVETIREQMFTIKDSVQAVEGMMESFESGSSAAKGDNVDKRLLSLENKVGELTTNMQEVLKLLRARRY